MSQCRGAVAVPKRRAPAYATIVATPVSGTAPAPAPSTTASACRIQNAAL